MPFSESMSDTIGLRSHSLDQESHPMNANDNTMCMLRIRQYVVLILLALTVHRAYPLITRKNDCIFLLIMSMPCCTCVQAEEYCIPTGRFPMLMLLLLVAITTIFPRSTVARSRWKSVIHVHFAYLAVEDKVIS